MRQMENLQLSGRINSALPAPYGLPITYTESTMIAPLGCVRALVCVCVCVCVADLLRSVGPSLSNPLTVKPQQELPYVLFDMRTPTPTVLSANVSFCTMLGYAMEEVLGRPWHYFIQDE